MQREHIDIDDLHQQMVEGLKQARKNVGASTCWDGYKAKGTKKKNGKEVPNCVKEEDQIDELYKGKHGQSEKEYQDGRSDGGKMISGDSKHSGAAYSHRSYKGVVNLLNQVSVRSTKARWTKAPKLICLS